MRDYKFVSIYQEAHEAGMKALENCKPNPMTVFDASLDGKPVPGGQSWFVEVGVCGFAWIKVRGNTSFGKWLKKAGVVDHRSYTGGYDIWVTEGNQSLQKKEAYAKAFAEILESYGIKAFVGSRMD